MRADHARSRSVQVVNGVRIVQCHAIIDVVIHVRVMQCHASIDVVIGVRVLLCHQEREREVRRMLPHRKHPCAFAQNLRLLTQLTQCSNYTLRLIESRCIIHPKPHTNDHSREHLARDLK